MIRSVDWLRSELNRPHLYIYVFISGCTSQQLMPWCETNQHSAVVYLSHKQLYWHELQTYLCLVKVRCFGAANFHGPRVVVVVVVIDAAENKQPATDDFMQVYGGSQLGLKGSERRCQQQDRRRSWHHQRRCLISLAYTNKLWWSSSSDQRAFKQ